MSERALGYTYRKIYFLILMKYSVVLLLLIVIIITITTMWNYIRVFVKRSEFHLAGDQH